MFLPDFINIEDMRFQQRHLAISADYRPMFKIANIALVLYINSHGKKASLLKLHLFSWALKNSINMQALSEMLQKDNENSVQLWSIEPALNRALRLGVSEGIFSMNANKYKLEEKGIELAKIIIADDEIFTTEKEFLTSLGRSVTENKISEISKNWLN